MRSAAPQRTLSALVAPLLALMLAGATDRGRERVDGFESHAGELLVADQRMPDLRFQRSVILMVSHGRDGAMGLIVNKTLVDAPLAMLLRDSENLGPEFERKVPVHYGGPVEPDKGFVLHSRDVAVDGTILIRNGFALSSNPEIIERIGAGDGPQQTLIAFGYAGWGPGQLEGEIARGDWHWAPADEALVFARDDEEKWEKAMASRSVDL